MPASYTPHGLASTANATDSDERLRRSLALRTAVRDAERSDALTLRDVGASYTSCSED